MRHTTVHQHPRRTFESFTNVREHNRSLPENFVKSKPKEMIPETITNSEGTLEYKLKHKSDKSEVYEALISPKVKMIARMNLWGYTLGKERRHWEVGLSVSRFSELHPAYGEMWYIPNTIKITSGKYRKEAREELHKLMKESKPDNYKLIENKYDMEKIEEALRQ